MADDPRRVAPDAPTDEGRPEAHRRLRTPGPWLVGVPAGLLLGLTFALAWAALHPLQVVTKVRQLTGEDDWHLVVEGPSFDLSAGWTSPSRWRWRAEELALISRLPHRPSVLLQDVALTWPRLGWSADGVVLRFRGIEAQRVDLHIEEVKRQEEPPTPGEARLVLILDSLAVEHFGMTMRKGINPELIIDAEHVSLRGPFRAQPFQHDLRGELAVGAAWVEVAGIRIDDLQPTQLEFTGPGLEMASEARLGIAKVDATMEVVPLIGPPKISMTARLHDTPIDGIADVIMGPGDLHFIGRVAATATLVAGRAAEGAGFAGKAQVNVRDVGFSKPSSNRAGLLVAVALAPFLHLDDEGNVVVGDLHGEISFTDEGISMDSVTYEAPHSVGELRGYVRSAGMSAKLHFRPRAGSAAIEWGFIIRGDVRKPKVALALPKALRAWTPCVDPNDCGLTGGPTSDQIEAEAEAEAVARDLERSARAAEAQARRDERKAAREARRAERGGPGG